VRPAIAEAPAVRRIFGRFCEKWRRVDKKQQIALLFSDIAPVA
jgi:hypothetical protein